MYCNIQIYLELNRCTIIYGEKIYYYYYYLIFWPLMQVHASYVLKNSCRWPRRTGGRSIEVKEGNALGEFRVAVMGTWPLYRGARYTIVHCIYIYI